MKRFSSRPKSWFTRRPKTIYTMCPACQRQAVSRTDDDPALPLPASGSVEDLGRWTVAQQAVDGLDEVDAVRRRQGTGDPVRDQALADIQAGFAQNVLDVARRLRRPGQPGDPR